MHLQIVDYNIIDASNIINILKYVMKKHDIKYCLELLNECLLYYQLAQFMLLTIQIVYLQSKIKDSTYSY